MFTSLKRPDWYWALLASCSVSTSDAFPQYGKRPGRESSAELKSEWRCAITSPYAFVMCTGTNLLWPFGYRLGVLLSNVCVFLSLNTYLYDVLYSVNTQLYISTVILYMHSDHIMATCFDRKRPSSGQ